MPPGLVSVPLPSKRQQRAEGALQAVTNFYRNSGLPGAVNQVKLIGRITVRGLGPLRDVVSGSAGERQ
jgi:hypothetical protein